MKKKDTPEMVSLNESFFSIETDNLSVEELDQRLELAVAATVADMMLSCETFHCGTFTDCSVLACTNFSVGPPV